MQIIDYYNIQLYRDPILFIPQSKATPQFSSIPLRAPLPISRIIALGGDPEKEKQSNAREIRRHLIRIIAARCPFGIPRAVFPITRENFLISNYLPPSSLLKLCRAIARADYGDLFFFWINFRRREEYNREESLAAAAAAAADFEIYLSYEGERERLIAARRDISSCVDKDCELKVILSAR